MLITLYITNENLLKIKSLLLLISENWIGVFTFKKIEVIIIYFNYNFIKKLII